MYYVSCDTQFYARYSSCYAFYRQIENYVIELMNMFDVTIRHELFERPCDAIKHVMECVNTFNTTAPVAAGDDIQFRIENAEWATSAVITLWSNSEDYDSIAAKIEFKTERVKLADVPIYLEMIDSCKGDYVHFGFESSHEIHEFISYQETAYQEKTYYVSLVAREGIVLFNTRQADDVSEMSFELGDLSIIVG